MARYDYDPYESFEEDEEEEEWQPSIRRVKQTDWDYYEPYEEDFDDDDDVFGSVYDDNDFYTSAGGAGGIGNKLVLVLIAVAVFLAGRFVLGGRDVDTDAAIDQTEDHDSIIELLPTKPIIDDLINVDKAPNRYFRSQLSASDQKAYDIVYKGISNYEAELDEFEVASADHLKTIMQAVFYDCAELFWYNGGYSYTYHDRGGYWDVRVKPGYDWDPALIPAYDDYVRTFVGSVVAVYDGLSDYEKVKGVYEYMVDYFDYNLAYKGKSLYENFVDRQSVCEGYARACQYILNELGVECIYVTGMAKSSQEEGLHAWNIVKIDGEYYQLDATWGDPKGTSAYNISYNYLNITDQEIGVSHRADDRGYPACTATAYNYFIYEGFYLTYYDRAKLKQMLMDSYYGGVPMNFKCSDSAVYYEIKNDLLSNYGLYYLCQEAFGFKPECKFYSEDEMYMIRIVWE